MKTKYNYNYDYIVVNRESRKLWAKQHETTEQNIRAIKNSNLIELDEADKKENNYKSQQWKWATKEWRWQEAPLFRLFGQLLTASRFIYQVVWGTFYTHSYAFRPAQPGAASAPWTCGARIQDMGVCACVEGRQTCQVKAKHSNCDEADRLVGRSCQQSAQSVLCPMASARCVCGQWPKH